jgi:ABC-type polysaccharide/polyol phosphate export permease
MRLLNTITRNLKILRGVIYFYFTGYVRRDPLIITVDVLRRIAIITPLILIGLLVKDYAIPQRVLLGLLVITVFDAGAQLSVDINGLRVSKFKDILVSSPVGSLTYAFGTAIGMSLPSLAYSIPLLIAYITIYKPGTCSIMLVIAVLALLWAVGILLGLIISLSIRSHIRLMIISDAVYTTFAYITPVYYPPTILPEQLRFLTYISPPANGVEAILVSSTGGIGMLPHVIILFTWAITLLVLALLKSKWRD